MKMTINDIAKLAGVSRTTISRVLNNKHDVNPETRERVLKVIEENNYYPSMLAKGIITKKNNTLGVIFPHEFDSFFNNSFFSEVLQGISKEATSRGYYLTMCSGTFSSSYKAIFNEGRVEGFIAVSPIIQNVEMFDEFIKYNIPVTATVKIPGYDLIKYVDVDNNYGAKLAVEHLISLRHEKIAMIAVPKHFESHDDRICGYKLALEKNNIPFRSEYLKIGDPSTEGGYSVARQLLNLNDPPTAIFANNDAIAIGAIKAIRDSELRVPEDISVVGFDDIFMSRHIFPPLTTVRQPAMRKGAEACRMLIDYIENGDEIHNLIFPVELVVRGSTAARR